jgi:hypothetical protein
MVGWEVKPGSAAEQNVDHVCDMRMAGLPLYHCMGDAQERDCIWKHNQASMAPARCANVSNGRRIDSHDRRYVLQPISGSLSFL